MDAIRAEQRAGVPHQLALFAWAPVAVVKAGPDHVVALLVEIAAEMEWLAQDEARPCGCINREACRCVASTQLRAMQVRAAKIAGLARAAQGIQPRGRR